MTTAMLNDRLVITNSADELPRMTAWLQDCATIAALPPALAFKLDLCLTEAVFNIISYAYADIHPHEITLELNCTKAGVRLVIRDDGRPFDLLAASLPEVAVSLEEAQVGGLGIPLIRKMADCRYERIDGQNVLTLELPKQSSSDHA